MRKLGCAVLLALAAVIPAARPEAGDVRKARAYLKEVKGHLLKSFIDRDKMTDAALVKAALGAMAGALEKKDFAGVDKDRRAAAKEAIEGEKTIAGALAAADREAGGLDLIRLADYGAAGMIRETGDPFSRILTQEDLQKLIGMMQGDGRKESAGCALQRKDGKVVVAYVQYGYPAYREGIEIGDQVLEIRGRKVADIQGEEINELLRLREGDVLELKVRRHARTYAFKIPRQDIVIEDVRSRYLGQGVGYLRLTMFDLKLVSKARSALRALKRKGMKALILDLRHNPGGALPAATGVADLFLPQGLVITRTESNYRPTIFGLKIPGFGGDVDFETKRASEFEEMPMVCLINRASASASELLSGALKDHDRAILVGETTYGKGVGQSPIILTSMFMKRYLYLTVMRYTTPDGTQVNHKGVKPAVEAAADRPSPDTFDAIWSLRKTGKIRKYVDRHWGDAFRLLAEYDGFETGKYPGFDAFYGGLDTKLGRDRVRSELRREARRKREEEGIVWMADLQSDEVLQRGLVELLDAMKKGE